MSLSLSHPVVRAWFKKRFGTPTDAQAQGWPSIAQRNHTLISAPTGSGKTLAAFLKCIDDLIQEGIDNGLSDATHIVYVSPLKALSNDIEKNLAEPLAEIVSLAKEDGVSLPEIRVAVRTGDTTASQRAAMAKRPPHILITTPESLFILLTSESGRRGLRGVRTLIMDEIHAIADDKRGSHLSLSVERLCALAEGPVTRIGLSATQRPIEEVARFLVGTNNIDEDGNPDCLIVDTGHARDIDLDIEIPPGEVGPIATHGLWAETLDRIAELVKEHRTTLVFVNTRRLVERVSHQLSERLGEEVVAAHHGSLSRQTRHQAEQKLKSGEIKACVATASLELGIDVGVVDLVCQIGSPRSIGLLLQRVGRSGHSLGKTPKGRLFPLTRDELLECAALSRAVRRRNLDTLSIPSWPLDILAQQIVAACANEDWGEDDLLDLFRLAYPYRELPREKYDQVIEVLSRGVAPREGRRAAYLHRDRVNKVLRGRKGARLAALTSGGAIPDTADYDVVADPEGTFVGTVNEDFAIESLAGDVFLLGNIPWRIRRVESGRVRVEDAQGAAPSIPFWLGEAPGRTRELSEEVSQLRDDLDNRLDTPEEAKDWLVQETGISRAGAEQVVDYLIEGKRILGGVPTSNKIIAERFFDESGGTQVIIHSPLGSRINRAWGLALRKQICRSFNFELQASATDDGLNFSLGPNLSFPLADVFRLLSPRNIERVLTQASLQAPFFQTRWRWNATRALAILRHTSGRKIPPPLQRMRADDLLAAVFPAQTQCQDNMRAGDIEPPDHPLVFETMRDCLTEAMDLDGLKDVLQNIELGEIETYARDTTQPSVFCHQTLNAMPYAFLDDAPLEERRSRAVTLRRALPEDSRDLGALDQESIEIAAKDAWPRIRNLEELHDALLTLGMMPLSDLDDKETEASEGEMKTWFEELVDQGRASLLSLPNGFQAWAATESAAVVLSAFPGAKLEPQPPKHFLREGCLTWEDAIAELVRGRVECSGPFSTAELAQDLGLPRSDTEMALARLENEGLVLRGYFRTGLDTEEFCNRRILARIHRATISQLRKEIEPVPAATFIRFLFRWQHAEPGFRLNDEGGLLEIVEQLQGFEAAAGAWEPEILSSRMESYTSAFLDSLSFGGEVVWGRMARRKPSTDARVSKASLSRNGPITLVLREDLDWILDELPRETDSLSGLAKDVLKVLSCSGASFLPDIVKHSRRLPSEVENALWQLVAAGRATADGFVHLRRMTSGIPTAIRRSSRLRWRARQRRPTTRWSLLEVNEVPEDAKERRAFQLLKRYGLVFPELLAREAMAPPWRDLLQIYRRAEARGEIRGGRFVNGFVGEQFALSEAVDVLRSVRKSEKTGDVLPVSACDPLNLAGILTPGPRVAAVLGNVTMFRDGVPVASVEGGRLLERGSLDDEIQRTVRLQARSVPALKRAV